MSTMKAVRLLEWGSAPVVVDVPVPRPGAGQVLLQVQAASLCHSDLHLAEAPDGTFPFDVPFTLGHEVAGRVVELGDGVDADWQDRDVVIHGLRSCGDCSACDTGRENHCDRLLSGAIAPGIGVDGGLAEYMLVEDVRQLVARGDVPADQAAPLTDAGLTSFHALHSQGRDLTRTRCLVVGVGGLGHMALQVLAAAGAPHVVAVEPRPEARESALALGAHAVYPDLEEAVSAEGPAFDMVVDFVGSQATAETDLTALAQGGALVLVGSAGAEIRVGKSLGLPRGWSVTAPFWGTRADLEAVVALAADGRLSAHIEHITLEQAPEAYERLHRGEVNGRAVVTFAPRLAGHEGGTP